jgi:ribosomal subunit interface protein
MSFTNIIFKNTDVTVKRSLQDLVEQKLTSLEKYIGDETDIKCEVEFEKVAPHNSGDIYRVEINLWLAGKMYRAESVKSTYEAAVDLVRDDLDRDLSKDHDKRQTLRRKGGREIKEAMRAGE